MDNVNEKGAFTAPVSINEGVADTPKFGGQVTKKSAGKQAGESFKSKKREIKVVAFAKGWFDCKRIEPGMKLTVSEAEFSSNWMQKI